MLEPKPENLPNNESYVEPNGQKGGHENQDMEKMKKRADEARTDEEKNPEEINRLRNKWYKWEGWKGEKRDLKKVGKAGLETGKFVAKAGSGTALGSASGLWKAGKGLVKTTLDPLWSEGGELIEFLRLKPLKDGIIRGYKIMRNAFKGEDKKDKK